MWARGVGDQKGETHLTNTKEDARNHSDDEAAGADEWKPPTC